VLAPADSAKSSRSHNGQAHSSRGYSVRMRWPGVPQLGQRSFSIRSRPAGWNGRHWDVWMGSAGHASGSLPIKLIQVDG
jgi:hypothetical protein